MGGRGSKSTFAAVRGPRLVPSQQSQQADVTRQPPTPANTPVTVDALSDLSKMTDDELAQLFTASETVDMPNHLNDVADMTQKFAFAAGVNEKPMVLDDADFDKYLRDNGIPRSDILSRSVNGATFTMNGIRFTYSDTDVTDLLKYSVLNYVGGKHGGQVYGAGTYFDRNGGQNTGYGRTTAIAVLNPQTARIIDKSTLLSRIPAFAQQHPKFSAAIGRRSIGSNSTLSVFALAMGYNVITDSASYASYHNIIDRKALIYRKSNL